MKYWKHWSSSSQIGTSARERTRVRTPQHCVYISVIACAIRAVLFITAKLRFMSLVHTHIHTHTPSTDDREGNRGKSHYTNTLICKLTSFHVHAHLYAHMYANLNVKEKVFTRDSKQQTLNTHGESIRKQWRNSKYRCKPTWARTRTHIHTPENKHWKHWKKERP